jgi:hypothetical protein
MKNVNEQNKKDYESKKGEKVKRDNNEECEYKK